jgi:hypothetical protein
VQWALAAVTLAGFLWLVVLFGLAWLQIPDPPMPRVGELPVPTVAVLGGVVAGLFLAALSRWLASVGARRRRWSARRRLAEVIRDVAEEHVMGSIRREVDAHDELCSALARAAGTERRR